MLLSAGDGGMLRLFNQIRPAAARPRRRRGGNRLCGFLFWDHNRSDLGLPNLTRLWRGTRVRRRALRLLHRNSNRFWAVCTPFPRRAGHRAVVMVSSFYINYGKRNRKYLNL